jgi:cyclomaltodextrinase / maltogenic alpha-amylase / neopullulanase
VAAEVPLGFWREYRSVVRSINPEAYLLGELWWEKWPDQLLDPEPFLQGDIFDAPMNYRWYRVARHFFNSAPDALRVSAFIDSLTALQATLRKPSNYAMMNLTSSHDAPRTLTSLYNKNKYKYNAKPGDDNSYKINKPDDATVQTLKLLVAHQFTYIGAPSIWAGDEMGMWGADDPATRKPLLWPEFDFEPETTHPLNVNRPVDEVSFNNDVFTFYRKVISIRRENPVLTTGAIDFIKSDNENDVLAYSRYTDQDEVIAVFNAGNSPQVIELQPKTNKPYVDRLGDRPITLVNQKLTITLKERTAAILVIVK